MAEREPTLVDVPESQRHRVCLCKIANGRMHLRGADCDGREVVKDCLIDCMTSFGIHGTSATEAAEFILSPASGLSVTQAETGGGAGDERG